MNLFAQSILHLPRKTVQWRRDLANRFDDDPRNDRAADELTALLKQDTDSVDQATWQQLEQYAGTPRLRNAVNDTSRAVGFKFHPQTLDEYFAVVIAKLTDTIH